RRHTRFSRDWSSDVCSSDLYLVVFKPGYQSQSDNLSARCDRIMFRHFQICEAGPSSSQDTSHVSSALVQLSSIECSSENLKITRSEERRAGKEGRHTK